MRFRTRVGVFWRKEFLFLQRVLLLSVVWILRTWELVLAIEFLSYGERCQNRFINLVENRIFSVLLRGNWEKREFKNSRIKLPFYVFSLNFLSLSVHPFLFSGIFSKIIVRFFTEKEKKNLIDAWTLNSLSSSSIISEHRFHIIFKVVWGIMKHVISIIIVTIDQWFLTLLKSGKNTFDWMKNLRNTKINDPKKEQTKTSRVEMNIF